MGVFLSRSGLRIKNPSHDLAVFVSVLDCPCATEGTYLIKHSMKNPIQPHLSIVSRLTREELKHHEDQEFQAFHHVMMNGTDEQADAALTRLFRSEIQQRKVPRLV